jgi:two-component system sensor histidine kinase KdpD
VTNQVDAALDDYRERHGIQQPWETRERVIVAITGSPHSDLLIRRAARIAERAHGELFGVHVRPDTGLSGPIDVHVISSAQAEERPTGPRLPIPKFALSPLPPRRQAIGWIVAAVGLPLLTLALANLRGELGLPSVLLLYLVLVVAVAAIGGVFPALAAAIAGSLLANFYFTPPLYRFTIAEFENFLALVLYLGGAGIVSVLVDRVARSRLDAAHARAEAAAMAALAGSLAEEGALLALMSHLRSTFGMRAVGLLHRNGKGDGSGWHVEAEAGDDVPASPAAADVVKEIGNNLVLVMNGPPLAGADHRVLNALAAQLATAVETRRLHGEAARAMTLAQANDLRAALLQAVSHDLRTPLASIKASISGIREPDVTWSSEQLDEFHATIEEETDRLDSLVANLLDMSRIQAGAVPVTVRPVDLEEVVPAAVAGLGPRGCNVAVETTDSLPPVAADPALLERVLANLLDNAVSASPTDRPVRVEAGAVAGRVDIRIVDQGPGIPRRDRDRVFQTFQRLVDHGSGVGLGLAIARGFVDAMGGEPILEDTPGGGVTMVVSLPEAH